MEQACAIRFDEIMSPEEAKLPPGQKPPKKSLFKMFMKVRPASALFLAVHVSVIVTVPS